MTVPDQGSVLPKTSVPTQVPSQPLRYGPGNASLVSFASRNIAFRNFRERGLFKKGYLIKRPKLLERLDMSNLFLS